MFCENNIESEISYICKNEYEYFFSKKNVVGIALGYKFTRGFYTSQKCITVFVCKKEPINILSTNDIIPKIYKSICTDVVESDIFCSQSLTQRVRPAIPGYSIGNGIYQQAGTFGCLVTDGHDYYVLSNNHILCECNTIPIGVKILQPAKVDGGKTNNDAIATLSKFIPLEFIKASHKPINFVDCALGKVIRRDMVSTKIALVGEIRGLTPPILNQSVKKVGRTTGLTHGKVTNVCASLIFNYPRVSKNALFQNQIITTSMSQGGDSGSVLLDDENRALGLLVGAGNTTGMGVYNCIPDVLNELKVIFA